MSRAYWWPAGARVFDVRTKAIGTVTETSGGHASPADVTFDDGAQARVHPFHLDDAPGMDRLNSRMREAARKAKRT